MAMQSARSLGIEDALAWGYLGRLHEVGEAESR